MLLVRLTWVPAAERLTCVGEVQCRWPLSSGAGEGMAVLRISSMAVRCLASREQRGRA